MNVNNLLSKQIEIKTNVYSLFYYATDATPES